MAVDLSYLDEQVQKWVYEYFKENGFLKPVQVEALKNYSNLSNVTQFSVIYKHGNSNLLRRFDKDSIADQSTIPLVISTTGVCCNQMVCERLAKYKGILLENKWYFEKAVVLTIAFFRVTI